MGDRANVLVREDSADSGVYLYTHWRGTELPRLLQEALQRNVRWNDCPYLTRIIFDGMSKGTHGQELGFGIAARPQDGEDRVLIVDVESQTVTRGNYVFSFEDFCQMEAWQLDDFWGIYP